MFIKIWISKWNSHSGLPVVESTLVSPAFLMAARRVLNCGSLETIAPTLSLSLTEGITPLTVWMTLPDPARMSVLRTCTPLTAVLENPLFLPTVILSKWPPAALTLLSSFKSWNLMAELGIIWLSKVSFSNRLSSSKELRTSLGTDSKAALVGAKMVAGSTSAKVSAKSALTTKSSKVVSPFLFKSSAKSALMACKLLSTSKLSKKMW